MEDGYRKVERINGFTKEWNEIGFSEIIVGDQIKFSDVEKDGTTLLEDAPQKGDKIYLVKTLPAKNKDGVLAIECDTVE